MSNIIVLNRGDTFDFDLTVTDANSETGRYKLKDNDALYLGIMDPRQLFEHALVKKKYTQADTDLEGNLTCSILPEDTLDLIPGKYYYEVKLKMDHLNDDGNRVEKVYTVVNKTKFILCD